VASVKGHETVDDLGISIYRIDRPPVKLMNVVRLQHPSGA